MAMQHIAVTGYLRIVRSGVAGDEAARNFANYVNAWGDQRERNLIWTLAMELEDARGEGEARRADVNAGLIVAVAVGVMGRYYREEAGCNQPSLPDAPSHSMIPTMPDLVIAMD